MRYMLNIYGDESAPSTPRRVQTDDGRVRRIHRERSRPSGSVVAGEGLSDGRARP